MLNRFLKEGLFLLLTDVFMTFSYNLFLYVWNTKAKSLYL